MELFVSKAKKTEAAKLGITQQQLVMADLMCVGYSEEEAYCAVNPDKWHMSEDRITREAKLETEKPNFKKAYAERIALHKENGISMDGVLAADELLDKRSTAKLILNAALKQPANSKERIEGLMKYSDLMRYKSDEVEGSTTDTIHFFLPMKCGQCPLLKNYNEKAESPIRPDEMGRIIKDNEKSAEA